MVRNTRPMAKETLAMTRISCTLWLERLAVLFVGSLFFVAWTVAAPAQATPSAVTGNSAAAPAGQPAADARAHDDSFVIGNDDVLSINVWNEPNVSRVIPVRSDGKISLPLAGEIQAAGQTPMKLERDITDKLKSFIAEPEVTVMVQEIKSQKFNILGQVTKPGSYVLANSLTVLDAIAAAGGFRDFAKQKNIYVLRQNPDGTQSKLPFNYKEVLKGQKLAQNIKLQARDTIVVP
jgi:polysaccharide biosynthesis/export protein